MPPGKPAAADLRLSLATAPVLFASQQFQKLRGFVARGSGHKQELLNMAETLASRVQ